MSLFEPEQPTSLQQQQHAQRSMDLVSRGQQRHHRHPSHEHAKHDAMNKDRHHLHPPPYQHYRSLPPQQKSSQTVVSCIVNLVLSKLLDALLFTSALALAAYNYWKGDLHKRERIEASPAMYDDKEQHRIMDIRQWRHTHPPLRQQQHHHHHPRQQRESLEDSKRRRTMEWAESMARQQSQHSRSSSNCSNSNSSSSSGTCNSLGNDKHVRIYLCVRDMMNLMLIISHAGWWWCQETHRVTIASTSFRYCHRCQFNPYWCTR